METELSLRLKQYAASVKGKEQLSIQAFAEALLDHLRRVRARYADGRMTEQSADAGRVRLTMPKGARALPTHIEWVPQLSNESGRKR